MIPPAIAPAAELCDVEAATVGVEPTTSVAANVAESEALVVKPATPGVSLADVVVLESGIRIVDEVVCKGEDEVSPGSSTSEVASSLLSKRVAVVVGDVVVE